MLRLCKDFPPGVEECCKTCPLQASSFRTLPPILAQEDVVLSVQANGEVLLGTSNLEICCLASSQSGMQAFLNLPLACPLEAESKFFFHLSTTIECRHVRICMIVPPLQVYSTEIIGEGKPEKVI